MKLPRLCLVAAMTAAFAVAYGDTQTFELTNLTWVNDTLNGFAWNETNVTSGEFVWTYNPGDFANGTGQLTLLGSPFASMPANAISTVDTTGITVTDSGNTDNLTYDVAINFQPNLTLAGALVSGGSYDITGSNGYFGGEFIGHFSGGSVVPAPEPATMAALAGGLIVLIRRRR